MNTQPRLEPAIVEVAFDGEKLTVTINNKPSSCYIYDCENVLNRLFVLVDFYLKNKINSYTTAYLTNVDRTFVSKLRQYLFKNYENITTIVV